MFSTVIVFIVLSVTLFLLQGITGVRVVVPQANLVGIPLVFIGLLMALWLPLVIRRMIPDAERPPWMWRPLLCWALIFLLLIAMFAPVLSASGEFFAYNWSLNGRSVTNDFVCWGEEPRGQAGDFVRDCGPGSGTTFGEVNNPVGYHHVIVAVVWWILLLSTILVMVYPGRIEAVRGLSTRGVLAVILVVAVISLGSLLTNVNEEYEVEIAPTSEEAPIDAAPVRATGAFAVVFVGLLLLLAVVAVPGRHQAPVPEKKEEIATEKEPEEDRVRVFRS